MPQNTAISPLFQAPPYHPHLKLLAHKSCAITYDPKSPNCYFTYCPSHHPISRRSEGDPGPYKETRTFPLVVLVHGSYRDAETLRDRWVEVAEKNQWFVLAPLFPADMEVPSGSNNYKEISYTVNGLTTRYDEVLLSMIDHAQSSYGYFNVSKFFLHGFSGGAQFVHRFMYLHPERLHAVSICAPGQVTMLNDDPWPIGIGGSRQLFDQEIDPARLVAENLTVQLTVGSADEWMLTDDDGNRSLTSRVERMQNLANEFETVGIRHSLVFKAGVAHDEPALDDKLQAFAELVLRH